MKYIRTKDGIYEVIEECFKPMENNMVFTPREGLTKILSQTDTIEELFDELVIHNPSNDGEFYPKHFVYTNKWETILQPMSDYQKSKGIEIYGAIWTDKGLIYVAKMNEKGELELL